MILPPKQVRLSLAATLLISALGAVSACSPPPPSDARALLPEIVEEDLGALVRQAESAHVTATAATVLAWEFAERVGGGDWRAVQDVADPTIGDGLLTTSATSLRPVVGTTLQHQAENLDYLWLRLKVAKGGGAQVRWRSSQGRRDRELARLRFTLPDGVFEDVLLPVGGSPAWKGRVRQLYLHPPRDCGSISIDFVRLLRAAAARPPVDALEAAPGKALIGHERRLAMLAPAPSEIRWRLGAAAKGRVVFSYGLLPDAWSRPGSGTRFSLLAARDGRPPQELFEATLDPSSRPEDRTWHDAAVEIDGGPVELVLRTEPAGGEAGFGYAVWGNPRHVPEAAGDDRTDVVLIALDTLRADRVGVYGYPRATTPRLDRLAAEGTVFLNALSQAPWSLPSYSSLFTSKVPSMSGVTRVPRIMAEGTRTLARLFHEAGYATVGLTNGGYAGLHWGMDRGFELFWEGTDAAELTRRLEGLLETTDDRPLLLYLHTYELHDHFQRRASHRRAAAELDAAEPEGEAAAEEGSRLYDGALRLTDQAMAGWLEALERRGLLDDAIVALFSDHGEALGEHGMTGHGHSLYEELIRVPLVITRHGDDRPPSRRVERVVNLIDLLPTLLELSGLDVPEGAQGRSLAPDVLGTDPDASSDRGLGYSELQRTGQFATRTGDLKYIYTGRPTVCSDREVPRREHARYCEELFELSTDPGERNNVASASPRRLAAARESFLAGFLDLTPGLRLVGRGPSGEGAAPRAVALEIHGIELEADGDGALYLEASDSVGSGRLELRLDPDDLDLVTWRAPELSALAGARLALTSLEGEPPPRLVGGSDCATPLSGAGAVGLDAALPPSAAQVALPPADDSGWLCLVLTPQSGLGPAVGQPTEDALERLRALGYLN